MKSKDYVTAAGGRQIWSGDKLKDIQEIERRLDLLKTPTRPHFFMKSALLEALVALHEGNYGIGAVITQRNRVIERGHNRIFHPRYDSSHHAEMDAVAKHEARMSATGPRVDGCTLFTTLEPCPMCYTRILTSGLKTVFFAVEDTAAGMVTLMANLKDEYRPLWKILAESDGRRFDLATLSLEARQLAWDMFACTKDELDAALVKLGGPFGDAEKFMMHGVPALHRTVDQRTRDGVVRKPGKSGCRNGCC